MSPFLTLTQKTFMITSLGVKLIYLPVKHSFLAVTWGSHLKSAILAIWFYPNYLAFTGYFQALFKNVNNYNKYGLNKISTYLIFVQPF